MIEYIFVVQTHGKPVFATKVVALLVKYLQVNDRYAYEELLFDLDGRFEIPYKEFTIFKVPIHDNLPPASLYPKSFPFE
jgi:hypothetical protein